jgi:hypothetical protein
MIENSDHTRIREKISLPRIGALKKLAAAGSKRKKMPKRYEVMI